jgi:hypothetical protein
MPQQKIYGRADLPVVSSTPGDHLSMAKYATALSRFIQDCETPITVGLQGEWGSGKTSLMNMIQEDLSKTPSQNRHLFLFQTWQYGALSQDELLGILLMKSILQAFVAKREKDDRIKWMSSRLYRLLGALTKSAVAGLPNKYGLDGRVFHDELTPDTDPGANLKAVRDEFANLVHEMTGGAIEEPGRVVVFIDDLDRVRPERAVAMLEIVKNFMDVERCVFVVACDYDVVQRGVQARLGIDEADKAEAFFHKLIQVPFSMPIAAYSIEHMFRDYLSARLDTRKNDVERIVGRTGAMIQLSTGTNPRAFKRFLNRVDLHACIRKEGVWDSESTAVGLVGIVALQLQWPGVAAYLSRQHTLEVFKVEFERLTKLVRHDLSDDSDLAHVLRKRFGDEWDENPQFPRLTRFMTEFANALETDGQPELSEAELRPVYEQAQDIGLTQVKQDADDKDIIEQPAGDALFYETWGTRDPWRSGLNQLATVLYEGRYKIRELQIHRNRTTKLFALKTKNGKRSVLAFYETGTLYAYFGDNAAGYLSPDDIVVALEPIAEAFRTVCANIGVEFKQQRKNTSCKFEPRDMDPQTAARFIEALHTATIGVNEVLAKFADGE